MRQDRVVERIFPADSHLRPARHDPVEQLPGACAQQGRCVYVVIEGRVCRQAAPDRSQSQNDWPSGPAS